MTTLWIVLSLALSLVLGFFMVRPLFEVSAAGMQGSPDGVADGLISEPHRALLDKKERVLRSYRDLELDHSMGKVSNEELARSKEDISRELAGVLEELRRYE